MRALFVVGGLLFVSACTALAPPVATVEGVSAVLTGKPLSDRLISIASGKNCSTVRRTTGRTYCVEDEINPAPRVWCYKSIGRVNCYDRPDPSRRRVSEGSVSAGGN